MQAGDAAQASTVRLADPSQQATLTTWAINTSLLITYWKFSTSFWLGAERQAMIEADA